MHHSSQASRTSSRRLSLNFKLLVGVLYSVLVSMSLIEIWIFHKHYTRLMTNPCLNSHVPQIGNWLAVTTRLSSGPFLSQDLYEGASAFYALPLCSCESCCYLRPQTGVLHFMSITMIAEGSPRSAFHPWWLNTWERRLCSSILRIKWVFDEIYKQGFLINGRFE